MQNFICPICKNEFKIVNRSLVCTNNHCFDIAKSGYINLLPANKKNSLNPGDNKEMIQARKLIMDKGYYKELSKNILKLISDKKTILDCGCGTGYILDYIDKSNLGYCCYGLDISKSAIETASKINKNNKFCVASSIDIPFKDNLFDVVIVSFAPVYDKEIYRVLKKDGLFIRIQPNVYHLYELKENLYDDVILNEIEETRYDNFKLIETLSVDSKFSGTGKDFINLANMTPYSRHTAKERIETISEKNILSTRTSFLIQIYEKQN